MRLIFVAVVVVNIVTVQSGFRSLHPSTIIFGQTRIFVSNIRFGFVCQSNILFGFPNICSKDTERMFSSLGLLLTKRRLSMTGENINIQLFLRDNLDV